MMTTPEAATATAAAATADGDKGNKRLGQLQSFVESPQDHQEEVYSDEISSSSSEEMMMTTTTSPLAPRKLKLNNDDGT